MSPGDLQFDSPSKPRATSPIEVESSSFEGKGEVGSASSRLPLAGPSTKRLISISTNMNSHLTTLLVSIETLFVFCVIFQLHIFQAIIQERDEERERLKRELQRTQSQIHSFIHGKSGDSSATSGDTESAARRRPTSFVSVEESSGGEQVSTTASDVDRNYHESDDEGEFWTI